MSIGIIEGDGWNGDTPPQRATYSPDDTDTQKARESHEDLHYLKPEQVKELAGATKKLRDELLVKLLFQTGVRVSELVNIRAKAGDWKDIDFDERSIKIRGKGRKNRTVYYQETLDLLMDIWLTERREAVFYAEESPYLFPTSHAEKITRQTVAEVVREAAEEAGLQEVYGTNTEGVELHSVTPHVLRHSFAMAALNRGWDVYTLSQALGHESTEITTSTYLHDDEDAVRDAYFEKGPRESAD
jgi:integrase/recombinase XerD